MKVYSLVSSRSNHPALHNYPPGHRTCSFMNKPSQLPGSIQPGCHQVEETIQTHRNSSRSTRYPLTPGLRDCLAQDHNARAQPSQRFEPVITRLQVAYATTAPGRPTIAPTLCLYVFVQPQPPYRLLLPVLIQSSSL